MSYKDIIVVLSLLIVALLILMFIEKNSNVATNANVYYKNELVLSIDLTKDETRNYVVEGTNGEVLIEASFGSIQVIEETSPFNICSKQGEAKFVHEVIVCLPNEVIIRLEGTSDIDTILR